MRPNPDRYNARCWLCNFWWLIILILLLLGAGLYALRKGGFEFLLPPTPTPPPTATPLPIVTRTATPLPTLTPIPTHTPQPTATVLQTGDVQITLLWQGLNDLDLHVIDPDGEEIYFGTRHSSSGGDLDVDSNAACGMNVTMAPVENVYWPTGGTPIGKFRVSVVFYEHCSGAQLQTPFTLRVLVDGETSEYSGEAATVKQLIPVIEFER